MNPSITSGAWAGLVGKGRERQKKAFLLTRGKLSWPGKRQKLDFTGFSLSINELRDFLSYLIDLDSHVSKCLGDEEEIRTQSLEMAGKLKRRAEH